MPQLSRKPLPKDFEDKIIKQLTWALTQIKTEEEMTLFLKDLLTSTEQTMLAKRLTVTSLLVKGWSWSQVCRLLHVSPATVNRMQIWMSISGGGLKKSIERLEKRERWKNFWDQLDGMLPDIPLGSSPYEWGKRLKYGNPPRKR